MLPDSALDLRTLYEQHGPTVHRLVSHLLGPAADPDDVTQDVFIVAWRKLQEVRPLNARAWLSQIALKRVAMWRRRAWVRRALGLEAAGVMTDWRTPERAAEANDARRVLYSILDQMSEKRRTVLILFELQGLTGEEIADTLGCPLQTVHTRLFHARREFAARIEAHPEAKLFDERR